MKPGSGCNRGHLFEGCQEFLTPAGARGQISPARISGDRRRSVDAVTEVITQLWRICFGSISRSQTSEFLPVPQPAVKKARRRPQRHRKGTSPKIVPIRKQIPRLLCDGRGNFSSLGRSVKHGLLAKVPHLLFSHRARGEAGPHRTCLYSCASRFGSG